MSVEAFPQKEILSSKELVEVVAIETEKAGGRALLVGGSVRDEIINQYYPDKNLSIKDYDFEVYGISPEQLRDALSKVAVNHGLTLNDVGKSFGILKLRLPDGEELDISIPRHDSKIGAGHNSFEVDVDPSMNFEDAARRRDLTINSMLKDPLTGEIIDPFNGVADIQKGILRATDPKTFIEDPLRVLRVVQFAGRLGFTPDENLIKVCQSLTRDPVVLYPERLSASLSFLIDYLKENPDEDPILIANEIKADLESGKLKGRYALGAEDDIKSLEQEIKTIQESLALGEAPVEKLTKDRIGREWRKLLVNAKEPSVGLRVAKEVGLLATLNPELDKLSSTTQDKKWHPEGNVWEHTLFSVDQATKIVKEEGLDENTALVIILATLLHDVGKPQTTKFEEGTWRSPGHGEAGVTPAEAFLSTCEFGKAIEERVTKLVANHMRVEQLYQSREEAKPAAIQRLANEIQPATIEELVLVAKADHLGRGTAKDIFEAGNWLLAMAKELNVNQKPPEPILLGRDLLAKGMKPGPRVGKALGLVGQAQLDGSLFNKEQAFELLSQQGYF